MPLPKREKNSKTTVDNQATDKGGDKKPSKNAVAGAAAKFQKNKANMSTSTKKKVADKLKKMAK